MKNRIYNLIYMVVSFYYEVKKRDESRPKLWFIRAATINKIFLYAIIYAVMVYFGGRVTIYAFIGLSLGNLMYDLNLWYRNKRNQ